MKDSRVNILLNIWFLDVSMKQKFTRLSARTKMKNQGYQLGAMQRKP